MTIGHGKLLFFYLSRGKIATKSHTSARQVLVIGNGNIKKIGSREVLERFHEPGLAVDGSIICIVTCL